MNQTRLSFIWDYDIDSEQFRNILEGKTRMGRLDRDWAAVRLIEYGSYREIVELLGFHELLAGWPRWRARVRSTQRKRGLDFLTRWLPKNHPELC